MSGKVDQVQVIHHNLNFVQNAKLRFGVLFPMDQSINMHAVHDPMLRGLQAN